MVTIEILTGNNYKEWKKQIDFALGIVDINMALREAKLVDLTDTSTVAEKGYFVKWERSNRLSLLAIRGTIPEHLMSNLPETMATSLFLTTVAERYKVNKNAEAGTLMRKLTGTSYNSVDGVEDIF